MENTKTVECQNLPPIHILMRNAHRSRRKRLFNSGLQTKEQIIDRRIREAVARETKKREEKEKKERQQIIESVKQFKTLSVNYANIKILTQTEYKTAIKENSFEKILYEICQKHDVDQLDIVSRRRHMDIVMARRELSYRCRYETRLSLAEIGRCMGGKDHATIFNQVNQWERLVRLKKAFEAGETPHMSSWDNNINWDLVE